MKTIAVLDEKGGVGKTTTATHVAAWAHVRGIRTVLLDCNASQGSALRWTARRPAGSDLEGLPCYPVHGRLTLPQLAALAGPAQLAVLDGMPYLGRETEHAAACADVVVLPVRPGQYDLEAAQQTHEALDRADAIRAALTPPRAPLRRLLLLTQSVATGSMEREALEVLEASPWGELVGVLRFRQAYARTAQTGESVWQLDPRIASIAQAEAAPVMRKILAAAGLGGRR